MTLTELPSPCAIVDLDTLERNAVRMAERCARLGVRLRPHVKTHKCAEAARLQVRGQFGGITVSTLAEVRFFAERGFRDITYAVPIAPSRIQEASELGRYLDRFSLLLDHPEALRELQACAVARRLVFSVFLKVDCGYHRAGVDPATEEAVELAMALHRSPHTDFRGLLTHAGHSYRCRNREEILRVACEERDVVVRFARRLREAGALVPEVSVGSTPTLSVAEDLTGVTEARPGNYVFYDGFQAAIGSCDSSDVAFSVLATVIGHYPRRNKLVIDAGALALSKDPGPVHVDPSCGYGTLCALDGRQLPGLRLVALSQEHGEVVGKDALDETRYPLGTRIRVIPNHSCLTAALYDRYYVVRNGRVADEWRPVRGW